MITAEWVTAIAAVISLFISVWAIVSVKLVERKIDIQMEGNELHGSGTFVHIGDKK